MRLFPVIPTNEGWKRERDGEGYEYFRGNYACSIHKERIFFFFFLPFFFSSSTEEWQPSTRVLG